ncbi:MULTISPECIES: G5 domain-containing protein [Exiguobacterium]|uniref:G5 domain-containing protein n=1 Tax=Exiguobacterium TaxID=33986 RepID=UPI001BE992CE|nr:MULTISPECIES: G5 domain-containing protein [Exiguobacterium]MCT4777671.1 G5 domain-containing protein [Exiguobacterium aquaticum]MCT4788156.1 G5 domain-containing protein [Exiguobacterium mexicanum]
MKRYGMHLFILAGLVLLVSLPTIGLVNYLDASAKTTATYKETTVAGIDVSGMTKQEAVVRLDNAIKDFNNTPFTVTLVDGTALEVGKDVVSFNVDATLKTASEPGTYPLVTTVDEERLTPYLENQPVTLSMVTPPLVEAASNLNSDVVLEMTATESEVVASITVSPTPAMRSALERMNGFEMEAGDIFSLKAFGEDFDALSTLGSSMYQLFAATPFQILERVQHETLPSGIELGYDVKVDERSNFAVQNTEQTPYALIVLEEGNAMTVQLLGKMFVGAYESRVEDVTSVPYQNIVRFSPSLTAGSSSVTQSGQTGESGKLYRVRITDTGESLELLGFDFYEPIPEIVTKSSVPLPPPEPVEPVIPTFPDETLEDDPFDDDVEDDGLNQFEEQPPVHDTDPVPSEGAVG